TATGMRRKPHCAGLVIFLAALFFQGVCARAEPPGFRGITFFRADLTLRDDAILEVREEIFVNNAARFYPYGFKRDLPISGGDRWDKAYVGEYKPDNGIRVNI